MKLIVTGSESFTLSGQTIDKLLRSGSGDAALLYLYILKTHGQSTDKEAEEALGKSKGWVADATATLSGIGLLNIVTDSAPKTDSTGTGAAGHGIARGAAAQPRTGNAGPEAQPREYSQDDIIEKMASGSDFTIVVEETKRRLGKPLSSDDMLRLYGIYDNLRLPPEVILQLITHCINECRISGDGRMPSVKYIEKAAYTWEREGVNTIERAEEYLKALEARKSARGRIKKILQINNREFSETEKHYVDNWISMGFEPEAIALAYDKTIINTGNLAYPYMDKILKKWDEKGLHTLSGIQEKDKKKQQPGGYNARGGKGYSPQKRGEPSREEIERMQRLRDKINE